MSGLDPRRNAPLGALRQRDVAPHIYESAEEARAHLREMELKATADDRGAAA